MKTHQYRTKYLLILSAAILLAASALVFGIMPTKQGIKQQRQEEKPAPKLPLIVSRVKKLEVISATIKEDGPTPFLVLEIRNNSDLAVTAIYIESGDEINTSGIGKQGDDDEGNPLVVIEPRGIITLDMALSSLIAGTPLRVSAATFADGSEDGDEAGLTTIHGTRKRDKAERDRRKGAHTP